MALITVPVTVPVIATHFRGDFGAASTHLGWAEDLSRGQSGSDKTEGFHSVLLPTHSGQRVCFTEHVTALGIMLGKLVAALGAAIGTAFQAAVLCSLTGLFVGRMRAAHLQLAASALFTRIQRQL